MRVYRSVVVGALVLALQSVAIAATITVAPFLPQSPLGSQVTVTIGVSGLGAGTAPSVGTFDLDLGFDPLLLSFVSATFSNQLDILGLGDIQAVAPSVGSVNVFELSLDSASDLNALQLPAFTLATLTFDTLAEGVSPLTVSLNALGDADGNALEANIQNGAITIQNGTPTNPTPEPNSTVLVAIGLLSIAMATRRIRKRRRSGALSAVGDA
jgi:hypothetical protein